MKRTAFLASMALVAACGGGSDSTAPPPPVPVASVAVDPSTASLLVGATTTVTATPRDASGNTLSGRAITWSSSNTTVATVSASGVVSGVTAGGPVTISASSGGVTGVAQVTVLAPVTSVSVDPSTALLLVGATTTVTATPRDASGNTLSGRAITWSSSNTTIATVSASGVVSGVTAGGPVTISATSEGVSGVAQVTVLAPVTSVVITGALNVKVGDAYTYTATLRVADGSVVSRPVSWSVSDPAKASITPGGVLSALQTGPITLVVTVDGSAWTGTTTAYDWTPFGNGSTFGVALPSDTRISNRLGTSENPSLVVGCSSGLLLAFVDTDNFVTRSGAVAYSFDNGPVVTQTWLEFDSFSALGFPGPLSATRNFVTLLTQARSFGFAFSEFNSTAKAMLFRVTGVGTRVGSWIGQCPASMSTISPAVAGARRGAPVLGSDGAPGATGFESLLGASGRGTIASAEASLRAEFRGLHAARAPALQVIGRELTTQRARRQLQ